MTEEHRLFAVESRRQQGAYLLVAGLIFALLAVHTAHRDFVGDFWEHAAVVRELATHPVTPSNPLVATNDPHPMFSPYTLAVALTARSVGADPIDVLAAAGLANLALLLVCLYAFAARFIGDGAPVPVLLFVLLLWGHAPWFYSGFLHIDALGYSLSYPATFAVAVMFAALTVELGLLRNRGRRRRGALVELVLLVAIVLVTHPLTAIPMWVFMVALAVDTPKATRVLHVVTTLAVIGAGVLLAMTWPYYPLWTLLTTASSATHETNRFMYFGTWATFTQVYAAAIGVPILLIRWHRNRTDALTLTFIGLAGVYVYGYFTERWAYGRVLSSLVLVLQLATADYVVRVSKNVLERRARKVADFAILVPVAALFVAMLLEFAPTFDRYVRGRGVVTVEDAYSFLGERVGAGSVVMSKVGLRDDASSYVVAAYGGRAVATPVLMFVPDAAQRLADVRAFFAAYTPDDQRRAILDKYDARYILAPGSITDDSLRWAWNLGSVVHNTDDALLFEVRRDR